MQIQNGSYRFNPVKDRGPQSATVNVNFNPAVSKAAAILTGFTAEFTPRDDHHLGQLNIQVKVPDNAHGSTIPVTVTLGLRDWSNEWDDKYDGTVLFSVIGE